MFIKFQIFRFKWRHDNSINSNIYTNSKCKRYYANSTNSKVKERMRTFYPVFKELNALKD